MVKMHKMLNMETVTATELKRNTSDILNKVVYAGRDVLIKRHGVVVAKVVAVKRNDDIEVKGRLKKYKGAVPGLAREVKGVRKGLNKDTEKRLM